jgi:PAS domain S-box-containing protein
MAKYQVTPTGVERTFGEDELIVSKTDPKGKITYVNDVFVRLADYSAKELVGAPHSIIRHPGMPRSVFKLLWDTIQAKHEIFAYVLNMSRNGDHYWVLAHVTPSLDAAGNIIGYHSNRRSPDRAKIAKIEPIYRELLELEQKPSSRKDGMTTAFEWLSGVLKTKGVGYDEFVLTL